MFTPARTMTHGQSSLLILAAFPPPPPRVRPIPQRDIPIRPDTVCHCHHWPSPSVVPLKLGPICPWWKGVASWIGVAKRESTKRTKPHYETTSIADIFSVVLDPTETQSHLQQDGVDNALQVAWPRPHPNHMSISTTMCARAQPSAS